jgi:hypothetical protein
MPDVREALVQHRARPCKFSRRPILRVAQIKQGASGIPTDRAFVLRAFMVDLPKICFHGSHSFSMSGTDGSVVSHGLLPSVISFNFCSKRGSQEREKYENRRPVTFTFSYNYNAFLVARGFVMESCGFSMWRNESCDPASLRLQVSAN